MSEDSDDDREAMMKSAWLLRHGVCLLCVFVLVSVALAAYAQSRRASTQQASHHTRFVYIPGGQGDARVFQYRVGADGIRQPLSPPSVTVEGSAYSVVVAPDRKSVYVPEGDYMNVAQFHVRPDGTLAPMRHPEIAADSHPSAMVFSPNGQNAYVSCSHGDICQYQVQHGGSLARLSPPTVSVRPFSIQQGELRDPSPVVFQQHGHRATVVAEWDDGVRAKQVWYQFQYWVRRDGRLVLLKVARVSFDQRV